MRRRIIRSLIVIPGIAFIGCLDEIPSTAVDPTNTSEQLSATRPNLAQELV